MKRLFQSNLVIGLLICVFSSACNGQHSGKEGGANGKPPSKEEILKNIERASKELGLNSTQKEKFKQIELDFHAKASQLHKAVERPGPQMKEKMDKLHKEKTEKLKAVLSETQMKKFQEMEKKRMQGRGKGIPPKRD